MTSDFRCFSVTIVSRLKRLQISLGCNKHCKVTATSAKMEENSELKIQDATAFGTPWPTKSLERGRRCERGKNNVTFCDLV